MFTNMPSFNMNSTADETAFADDICTLDDGRRIAYDLFGAKEGYPVFHLHGWPGSRTEGSLLATQAADLGVRIIAVDRPGIGLSTRQPRRTILDHALDIRQVAKHLGIKEYSVMGVSGGGQYALACAFSIPQEELRSVALVCGQGPIDVSLQGMTLGSRMMLRGFRNYPLFLRYLLYGVSQTLKLFSLDRMSNERFVELFHTFDLSLIHI